MKLTPKQKKEWRKRLLEEQQGLCALCGRHLKEDESTLDHCHDTGHIRGALHRECNRAEGQISSRIVRCRKADRVLFATNLARYWSTDYTHNPKYPQRTKSEESKIKYARRMYAKARTERTKDKWRKVIQDLGGRVRKNGFEVKR